MDKKVSVVCVTYNQEKYIRQALDSIVQQKTNFSFQIFVGDDASTDGTAQIISEYANKYPELIIHVLREKNIGPGNNSIDLYKRVNTPYVAVCDGDDYWCDEYKLQKQVDFLDSHPDYTTVFSQSRVFFEDGRPDELLPPLETRNLLEERGYLTPKEIIENNNITPVSLMWRWQLSQGFPDWYSDQIMGDFALNMIHAKVGKVGYIPETLVCYRRHSNGMWQAAEDYRESFLKYGYTLLNSFVKIRDYYQGLYINEFTKTIHHFFKICCIVSRETERFDLIKNIVNSFPKDFLAFLDKYESIFLENERLLLKKNKKIKKQKRIILILSIFSVISFLGLIFVLRGAYAG